jgi:hypothetical protein
MRRCSRTIASREDAKNAKGAVNTHPDFALSKNFVLLMLRPLLGVCRIFPGAALPGGKKDQKVSGAFGTASRETSAGTFPSAFPATFP